MRRGLWGAAALLALAGVWILAPRILQRMDVFRVRRVEVLGAHYLSAADVTRGLGLGPSANVFDDVRPLAARALAIRGVRFASVRSRIPGTLEVRVEEFEPVALAPVDGKLTLVDRRGRSLPFDPTRTPTDLPIAEADPSVAGLLDRLKDADPQLFALVHSATRNRNVIVVETRQHRILFRVGASVKDIQAAAAVGVEVARRQMSVAELDARFEGLVVVRGRRV